MRWRLTRTPRTPSGGSRWDIHDDETDIEGHVVGSVCGGGTLPNTDAVDNCLGGGPDGPFSRVFGDTSSAGTSVGPFDPLRPDDTLLSNGTLDSGDAPMPAARIDVSIAQNSGGAGDISGVGSLAPANKAVSYSRDFTGNPTQHNLYAPFYSAYIPATIGAQRCGLRDRWSGQGERLPRVPEHRPAVPVLGSGLHVRVQRGRADQLSAVRQTTRRPTARRLTPATTTSCRRARRAWRCTRMSTVRPRCSTCPAPGSTSTA